MKLINHTGMTLDTPTGKLPPGGTIHVPHEWLDAIRASNAIWAGWFKDGKLEVVEEKEKQ